MTTVYVWMLIYFASGRFEYSTAVIDNIASQEECVRLQELRIFERSQCVQVLKIK